MMASETEARVTSFFESYRMAFERLDAPAIADHFAYPSHITSDAGDIVLTLIPAKREWIGQLEELLGTYRTIGVSSVRVLELAVTELSPRVVQAIVHWALRDRAGRVLYDFEAMYTLANINGTFRIAAISHNEIPRYRAALARLKSQHQSNDNSY